MVSRKKFLKNSTLFGLGTCCFSSSLLMQSCSTIKTISPELNNGRLIVSKSDLLDEKQKIIIHNAIEASIFFSIVEENPIAVLLLCTHKNCELKSTGSYHFCPCHGSEFTNQGKVIKGPAINSLKRFKVEQDSSNFYIYLS